MTWDNLALLLSKFRIPNWKNKTRWSINYKTSRRNFVATTWMDNYFSGKIMHQQHNWSNFAREEINKKLDVAGSRNSTNSWIGKRKKEKHFCFDKTFLNFSIFHHTHFPSTFILIFLSFPSVWTEDERNHVSHVIRRGMWAASRKSYFQVYLLPTVTGFVQTHLNTLPPQPHSYRLMESNLLALTCWARKWMNGRRVNGNRAKSSQASKP